MVVIIKIAVLWAGWVLPVQMMEAPYSPPEGKEVVPLQGQTRHLLLNNTSLPRPLMGENTAASLLPTH
jgi:hypothetical protein